ncbi:copper homeostasis protein cutC homolog isoform X1 [Bombyx mori]|uniref:Copper homeostasis protein cutC homolog n=2 Tax=Bombyx mori TaxID=7091 RepID=A0A8R2HSF4_BOMMO|nr:copper homeostasis protein cutC homolog isoform X1 [Bombyx mori]
MGDIFMVKGDETIILSNSCNFHGVNDTENMLEVCIDSLESAINAIYGGADELEVCSSLTEGGLTPSPGLVSQIASVVNNIKNGRLIHKSCSQYSYGKKTLKVPKVNVMIRCRTGSDFCYNDFEMDTMLSDIDHFKQFEIDRFVFGALTDSQEIDEKNCKKIIERASPTPVTFHRAFDVCKEPNATVTKIINLGFNRLLTSGQRCTAADSEALVLIRTLLESFSDKIEIMPGAGVNVDNAKLFIDMGCKILHSSCKITKYLNKAGNNLRMGEGDSEFIYVTDENIVKEMKLKMEN